MLCNVTSLWYRKYIFFTINFPQKLTSCHNSEPGKYLDIPYSYLKSAPSTVVFLTFPYYNSCLKGHLRYLFAVREPKHLCQVAPYSISCLIKSCKSSWILVCVIQGDRTQCLAGKGNEFKKQQKSNSKLWKHNLMELNGKSLCLKLGTCAQISHLISQQQKNTSI